MENDKSMVDIGTDHAYLPIYLLTHYNLENILATDIAKGPLEIADKNIKKARLEAKITLLQSDGLANVNGSYDSLVIAGMGGILIASILERGKDKLPNFKRIIIEANKDAYEVRKLMTYYGYHITHETMIFDYKYYEVIVFESGDMGFEYGDFELKYGPLLLKEKSETFVQYYTQEINHLKSLNSNHLKDKIAELEKVLNY